MQSLPDSVLDGNFKVCARCGKRKPWREYTIRKDRGTPAFICKPCNNTRAKTQYKPHPRQWPVEKACSACKIVLPVESFPPKGNGRRRAVCGTCHAAQTLAAKRANPEKIRASSAAYRNERRGQLRARQQAWREAHPERYFEIHSGWKKRNPDAVRAMGNKRRVLVEQAGPHYTAAEWKALKAEFDHRCLMCWRQEPDIRLTVDHIVPISAGGSNSIDNLQPLCRPCNSKKHRGILDLRTEARTRLRPG